jgi:hypothetical protein
MEKVIVIRLPTSFFELNVSIRGTIILFPAS